MSQQLGWVTVVPLTTAQSDVLQQSKAEHNGHSPSGRATPKKVGISDLFPLPISPRRSFTTADPEGVPRPTDVVACEFRPLSSAPELFT